MNNRSRFERGTGLFKCKCCGNPTRNTTGVVGLKLCSECNEVAMQVNSVSDGIPNAQRELEYAIEQSVKIRHCVNCARS